MSIIYIVSSGGKLSKNGETLVYNSEESKSIIYPYNTEQLIFIGSVEITGAALSLIMRHKLNTIFLNKNGRFNGKLTFGESKNVYLRMKQYELLKDDNFRLNLSKKIVSFKIKNEINFMQEIKKKKENASKLLEAIEKNKSLLSKIENSKSLDELRGIEGNAAKNYFSVFGDAIIQPWAIFNGRSKNPPLDNVNSVLSFIYTLLYYRIESSIEIEGLDPYVGYFHSVDYGKKTLTFDLIEEFRVPIADRLTVSLFNLGILSKEDFEEKLFSSDNEEFPIDIEDENKNEITEKNGIIILPEGIRKIITHFEKKLDSECFYQPLNKVITYKRIIREQVAHFKRVINGEESEYNPIYMR